MIKNHEVFNISAVKTQDCRLVYKIVYPAKTPGVRPAEYKEYQAAGRGPGTENEEDHKTAILIETLPLRQGFKSFIVKIMPHKLLQQLIPVDPADDAAGVIVVRDIRRVLR